MYEVDLDKKERAILVGMSLKGSPRWETEDHLEELSLLTDTAGAVVIEKITQEKARIDPGFYIGEGKAQELSALAEECQADLVIFDDDL
ncbi:MAG: GTPase HflX, partial [bacterium]